MPDLGFHDRERGVQPDTVTALEIAIDPAHLGAGCPTGCSRRCATPRPRRGSRELVAPVRPNEKHREPHLPMAEYVTRTRADGLPVDAWLRTHVRPGATIDSVATRSMVMAGTLDEWRERTGLPFDEPGEVVVPGALTTVLCRPDLDVAVYVEPNVWVRHRLR